MSIQPLSWDDFEDSSVASDEPTVITGWRLWIARGIWSVVLLTTIGIFVSSIQPYFDFVMFFPKFWFSSPDYSTALEQLNLSAGFYHGYLNVGKTVDKYTRTTKSNVRVPRSL